MTTVITHICTQCGKTFERNLKGIKKSGRTFCSTICHLKFHRETMIELYRSTRDLKPATRWFLIELPLQGYNSFFKRNVPLKTFIDIIEELASKIPKIAAIEYFIFSAYYIAASRDCKTYVSLDEMFVAFPSAKTRRVNRYVLEKSSSGCTISNRIGATIIRDLGLLKRENIVNDDERAEIQSIIDNLGMKDLATRRLKASHAIVYVASILDGIEISTETISSLTGTSAVSIRNNARYIKKMLENDDKFKEIVAKKGKINL